MTRKPGKLCRVRYCARNGTDDLPLPDGTALDVLVCQVHADEIGADPAGWKITSEPVDKYGDRARILVERARPD